ncbi:hypothetical protein EVAR_46927_1 [Eumeta japonica]|uniref:Uncharacterized protein n=1 Tax=Eumeta variegata TaxID=151549 RepID=A0A4C1Y207_EUMVA|nr:hypothetical protein EVAR_46927_1 [Eumeta japonica]
MYKDYFLSVHHRDIHVQRFEASTTRCKPVVVHCFNTQQAQIFTNPQSLKAIHRCSSTPLANGSVIITQNSFKHFQSYNFDVKDEPRAGGPVTGKINGILEKVEQDGHFCALIRRRHNEAAHIKRRRSRPKGTAGGSSQGFILVRRHRGV